LSSNYSAFDRQQQSSVQAIILSPTRELSLQTFKVWNKLSSAAATDNEITNNIRAIGIHGGVR